MPHDIIDNRSGRNYFVDEAGDSVLFNRKGHVIVATEGCSRFFILGMVDIPDPGTLGRDLDNLRKQLLADPYFKGVPSMQPKARKTAFAFHAKDDLPEVRREVFSLLRNYKLHFSAVVRDKHKVSEYVRQRNEQDRTYRYNPNELYDDLVSIFSRTAYTRTANTTSTLPNGASLTVQRLSWKPYSLRGVGSNGGLSATPQFTLSQLCLLVARVYRWPITFFGLYSASTNGAKNVM